MNYPKFKYINNNPDIWGEYDVYANGRLIGYTSAAGYKRWITWPVNGKRDDGYCTRTRRDGSEVLWCAVGHKVQGGE